MLTFGLRDYQDSTVIRDLGKQLGIKLSFSRDPKTQVLSLVMHGSKDSVAQGRSEVEGLAEVSADKNPAVLVATLTFRPTPFQSSHQSIFELPSAATTLRPEVYQHVSRLTKTFLEPGENLVSDWYQLFCVLQHSMLSDCAAGFSESNSSHNHVFTGAAPR